jgi:uncharacterized protein with FMN-binding domain
MKDAKCRKRTWVIIAVTVLVIVAAGVFLAGYLLSVQRYQDTVAGIRYEHANATGIPDGSYIGECDVQFIYARVEVTVKDGRIIDIDLLEHRTERGSAAEGIGDEIVAQQRIDVDAVSGATNSSTVIKKAVDNALSSAPM